MAALIGFGFLLVWVSVIGTHAVMRGKLDLLEEMPFRSEVILEPKAPVKISRSFRIEDIRIARCRNVKEMMQGYMRNVLIQMAEEALNNGLIQVRAWGHYPSDSTQYDVTMALVRPPEGKPYEY
ncbi:MAG TPA: hypothetical protein VHO03_16770 [Ignavibacteriales bacterium]|nr:hypothetical protein [Ignavibacteriales bacterium]